MAPLGHRTFGTSVAFVRMAGGKTGRNFRPVARLRSPTMLARVEYTPRRLAQVTRRRHRTRRVGAREDTAVLVHRRGTPSTATLLRSRSQAESTALATSIARSVRSHSGRRSFLISVAVGRVTRMRQMVQHLRTLPLLVAGEVVWCVGGSRGVALTAVRGWRTQAAHGAGGALCRPTLPS